MEWYHYVLIVVGVLLLAGIIFGIYYGVSVSKKNKTEKQAIGYYVKIIDAMGGIDNINDVIVMSSRLTILLNNYLFISTLIPSLYVELISLTIVMSSSRPLNTSNLSSELIPAVIPIFFNSPFSTV